MASVLKKGNAERMNNLLLIGQKTKMPNVSFLEQTRHNEKKNTELEEKSHEVN